MRRAIGLLLVCLGAVPATAAGVEHEAKIPYALRVVLRASDHPSLTPAFRADLAKQLRQTLQNALGPLGVAEVIDLAGVPKEKRDPLWQLVADKGLEALDTVNAANGIKTHFVFVDMLDGQYQIRLRQHDGLTGTATPLIRTILQGDRQSVGRVTARGIGEDFGFVGTFDPGAGPVIPVTLKAGDLAPIDSWVKKGDVFAVVQMRETRRAARPAKDKEGKPITAGLTGARLDGIVLQVQETPKSGTALCKLHSRFRGGLPRDGNTVGYRVVKLGTTETIVRLRLTDMAGNPLRGDSIRVRVGETDFPTDNSREREEMVPADGGFVSKQPRKNLAFVLVTSNESPVARIPLELFAGHTAVRKVNLDPSAEARNDAADRARDMLDRIRSARVMTARVFDELTELQKKEKPKALEYGEAARTSLEKEAGALRSDLTRLKERLGKDAPAGTFDAGETDLRALIGKTQELQNHLTRLKEVIRIENDPAAQAKRKGIEGLLLDAKLAMQKADFDQAIAKYEEAIKLSADEPAAKEELEKALAQLNKDWAVRDADHAAARKFVYEVWTRWEKPAEMREGLAEAKRAIAKCMAVNDKMTLLKFYVTGPQALERFYENVTKLTDAATEDEDKAALKVYPMIGEEYQKLLAEAGKVLGVDVK